MPRALPTRIDLLRHGETTAGARYIGSTDVPLTTIGRQQMTQALVDAGPWDCIISSPLRRCAEFAADYAANAGGALVLDAAWQEIHFGAWENCSADELLRTDPQGAQNFWADPLRHTPTGAETLRDFQHRILSAWQACIVRYAGQRVLLITHGGVMRVLRCHLEQLPLSEVLSMSVPLGALHRVAIDAAQAGVRA